MFLSWEVVAVWRTVDEMADVLRYADEDGALVWLVTPSAVKAAAQRGAVGARKDERGHWLVDDGSEGALRWLAKRERREREVRARVEERHREENVEVELGLLRKDRRELTDLCEDLRGQLARARSRIEELEARLREAEREANQARFDLERERTVSEERLTMVKTLTEALSKPFSPQTDISHPKSDERRSQAPSNTLEGDTLLEAWKRYEEQQATEGLKASKAAFAREHGMAVSTFKGRLTAAQRHRK